MQMIKRTGLMEFWPPVPVSEVGGLDLFKQYLENRMKAYEPENEHLPKPKALLLVGIPGTGKIRFIEVKGRIQGATTVTVSKNEILAGLNKPDEFFLAVVEVDFMDGVAIGKKRHYIQKPFQREPDFAATSVNYEWRQLIKPN